MPPVPVVPRPLNAAEQAVLEHLLAGDFPGAPELRSQLEQAEVIATWTPDSVSVDLRVLAAERRAPLAAGLVPVDAQVLDERGEYVGELLVWVEDGGVLAGLEYAWVTDEMPTALPPVERIRRTPGP
ncbi:hypothetical protein [Kitasatospora sp. NBC_01266]|uniref:hypothetical protein n=1 Tax=Kitasatospora sp. NBC_01266 TaxID=2903572 RepID=UPI002E359676|nr:hypothetical protein [Kitasatospora sp. NBC_01266]